VWSAFAVGFADRFPPTPLQDYAEQLSVAFVPAVVLNRARADAVYEPLRRLLPTGPTD
jgi:hypothetical protein